jgi:hypothetical protein
MNTRMMTMSLKFRHGRGCVSPVYVAIAADTSGETIPLRSVRGKGAERARGPMLHQLFPRSCCTEVGVGRSSGFRVVLLPAPSRPCGTVANSGFRRRLQQRDCGGFAPPSLGPFKVVVCVSLLLLWICVMRFRIYDPERRVSRRSFFHTRSMFKVLRARKKLRPAYEEVPESAFV